jgi:hypothetical protein
MSKRTIFLNTAYNLTCRIIDNSTPEVPTATVVRGYSFDTPPIDIKNNSKIRVKSLIHKDTASGKTQNFQCIFKIKDIRVNNYNYWQNDTDNAVPTIFIFDSAYPSYNDTFELTLQKQTIQNITLLVSSDFSNLNAGIPIGVFNFCMVLEIEDA